MSAESPIQEEEFILRGELLKHNQRIQREILAIFFPKKQEESEVELSTRQRNSTELIAKFSGAFRDSFKRRVLQEEDFLKRCDTDVIQVAREFIEELGIEEMAQEVRNSEGGIYTSSESSN